MFKRSRIAMLVAGALFAAQAGANPGYSEAMWSDSFPPPEQITVFNPDGSSYSYEFTLVEPVALSEPIDVIAVEDDVSIDVAAMEDDVSIDVAALEDDASIDVAALEYDVSIDVIAMEDDVSINAAALEDDVSIDPVALSDDDALSQPVYVAHFVSPPSYTGILEEARS